MIEGAADTSQALEVQVARQWKTPRKNLDGRVDNSWQARVGVRMPLSKIETVILLVSTSARGTPRLASWASGRIS